MAGSKNIVGSTILTMSRLRAQQVVSTAKIADSTSNSRSLSDVAASYSSQRDSATWKFREGRGRNGSGNVAAFVEGRKRAEKAAIAASSTDMKAGAINVVGESVAGLSATAMFRRQRAVEVMSRVTSAETMTEVPASFNITAEASVFAHRSAASLWRRERDVSGNGGTKIPNPSSVSIGITAEERLVAEAAILSSMGVTQKTAAVAADAAAKAASKSEGNNGFLMQAAVVAGLAALYTYFQQPAAVPSSSSSSGGSLAIVSSSSSSSRDAGKKTINRSKSNNPEVVRAVSPPLQVAVKKTSSPKEIERDNAMSKQPLWLQRRRE